MSLGRHTLVNLASAVLPMGLGLVTVPLYLHAIGAERYGTLAVIWALLAYFGFMDLGFGIAVGQRIASLPCHGGAEPGRIVWTGLLSTISLGVISSVLLAFLSRPALALVGGPTSAGHEETIAALRWLLLAPPVLLPTTVLMGALGARMRFGELGVVQVLGSSCSQLFPLAMALSGATELDALIPSVLASRYIVAIVLFLQCRRYVPLVARPCFDMTYFKELLGFGGWLSIKAFLSPLLVTFDRFVIASHYGAAAVVYYTVPYDIVSRTAIIPGSLASALFPRLASMKGEEAKSLAYRSGQLLLAVMTPIVIAGISLSRDFFDLWISPSFSETAFGVSELLLLGVWLNSLSIPHHINRMASGDARTAAMINLFETPLYAAALWFGLKCWNVQGAAAAYSLRVLFETCVLLHVNGVFFVTWTRAIPYFILIAISMAGVCALPHGVLAHIGIAVSLVGICLLIDRKLIALQAKSLVSRKLALSHRVGASSAKSV